MRNRKALIRGVLTCFSVALIVAAAVLLWAAMRESSSARQEIDFDSELSELAVQVISTPVEQASELPELESLASAADAYPGTLSIDWDALLERNSATVGWIHQEGTDISYPVVQGQDNQYWLNRRFDGEDGTKSGTIFVDARCDMLGHDLILYGHNMDRNYQLKFSSLALYFSDPEYLSQHPTFEFYNAKTGTCTLYRVFSCIKANVAIEEDTEEIYQLVPDEMLEEYALYLQSRSCVDAPVEIWEPTDVMVLSTCIPRTGTGRYIVCGIAQ